MINATRQLRSTEYPSYKRMRDYRFRSGARVWYHVTLPQEVSKSIHTNFHCLLYGKSLATKPQHVILKMADVQSQYGQRDYGAAVPFKQCYR